MELLFSQTKPDILRMHDKMKEYKSVYNYIIYNPPFADGTLSKLYLCTSKEDKSNRLLVAKAIALKDANRNKIFVEGMLINEASLSNSEYFVTHQDKKFTTNSLYIFYPLMNCGTLENYLIKLKEPVNEKAAIELLFFLSKSLECLHSRGIVHRDVNPNHILMNLSDKYQMKLGGFLCSHSIKNHGYCQEMAGMVFYMAPEVKSCSEPEKKEYGMAVDIYGLGMTMYRIIFGTIDTPEQIIQNIKKSKLNKLTIDLILKLIEKDPTKRITAKEILNSPVFNSKVVLSSLDHRVNPIQQGQNVVQIDIPVRTSRAPYIIDKTKKLGQGGFSKVFMCYKEDNPEIKYAMKIVKTHKISSVKIIDQLKSEINFMVQMKKMTFVINLLDYFYYKNKINMVLEYCNGDNLQVYLDKLGLIKKFLDFEEFKLIAWNVAQALHQMHSKNIIHRDIKPLNVLLVKNQKGVMVDAKLCDFGLSKQTCMDCLSVLGTPSYFSPELFELWLGNKSKYTNKVDVWSFGCLLFLMAFNLELFEFPSNTRNKVCTDGIIHFPNNRKVSPELIDLLKVCLKIKPEERPSFEQILSMKFFSMISIDEIKKFPYTLLKDPVSTSPEAIIFAEKTLKYSIKKIPSSVFKVKDVEKHLNREIDILTKMKGCPNLVPFEKAFKFNNDIYLIFLLCNGGNLLSFMKAYNIKSYPFEFIRYTVKNLAEGLAFLHSRDVIHRSLNPTNIFLSIDKKTNEIISCSIGDFGLSRIYDNPSAEMSVIASGNIYSSPELIKGEIYRGETDIYSLGIIIYFLVYGIEGEEFLQKQNLVQYNNFTPEFFPNHPTMTNDLKSLIINCIREPLKRFTAEDILALPLLKNIPDKIKIK